MPEPSVAQELQALRETVERLRLVIDAQRRVTLTALPAGMYLGQPVSVSAQVTDASGKSVPDAPVTVVVTWGRLRAVTPNGVLIGSTLKLRTGSDGAVRFLLMPPLVKDLYQDEQSALQSALRLLDEGARIPNDTDKGLQELVRRYRWEASVDLREAVDAYFNQFFSAEFEPRYDVMSSWSYVESTLIAYVSSGDDTQTLGSAVMTFNFKNWLPAWLETYSRLSQSWNTLNDTLIDATRFVEDAPLLREILDARTRDYVNAERGSVGEFIGRKVADVAVKDFVNKQVGKLPLETRVGLLPSADTATSVITSVGPSVLSAVGTTQVDLERKIDPTRFGNLDLSGVFEQMRGLEAALASKVDQQMLDQRFSGLEAALASKVDQTTLDQRFAGFEARLEAKVDQPTLDGRFVGLDSRFDSKVDQTTLDQRFAGLDSRFDAKVDQPTLDQQFAGIEATFNSQLDNRFTDLTTATNASIDQRFAEFSRGTDSRFNDFQSSFDQRLNGVADKEALTQLERSVSARFDEQLTSRLTELETNFNRRLEGVVDRNSLGDIQRGLQTQLNELFDRQMADVRTTIRTQIREELGGATFDDLATRFDQRFEVILNDRLGEIDQRLTGRVTAIETNVTTRFTGLETTVTTLQGTTTRLNTQVTGLETNVRNFRNLRGPNG